jgi:hypothetical protein
VASLDPQFQNLYQQIQSYDGSGNDAAINDSIKGLLGAAASYNPQTGNVDLSPTQVNRSAYSNAPRLQTNLDQYFNDSIATPLLRKFDQTVAPRIASQFAGQGAAFSTRRGTETAQQLGNLQANIADQYAQTVRQDQLAQFNADTQSAQQQNQLNYNYDTTQAGLSAQAQQLAANTDQWQQALRAQLAEAAQGRRQTAIGQAQQQSLIPLQRIQGQQQLLAPFQQNAQDKATAKYNEFLRTAPENSPYNQLALAFTGQQQQVLQNYNNANPWVGAIKGAMGGAQAGSAAGPWGALIGGVAGGAGGYATSQ